MLGATDMSQRLASFFFTFILVHLLLQNGHSYSRSFRVRAHPIYQLSNARPLIHHGGTPSSGFVDRNPTNALTAVSGQVDAPKKPLNNIILRWLTGLSLGGFASLWIASGNLFTLGFLAVTLITQKEYDAMLRGSGITPSTNISLLAAFAMFITANIQPAFHEILMPLSGIYLMISLLLCREKSSSISDISASLWGIFYLGFMPSYWVRLRGLASLSSLASLRPVLGLGDGNFFVSKGLWSVQAAVMWWTWTSIVFSDVGAYFFGKSFGKHKLSAISKSAGAASPNKTVEGALGGFFSCSLLMTLGAYLMQWPVWSLTGPAYGLLISVVGLVGDLTASMMKRDAGLKDTGSILPGHGGLLDRIDSYMLAAPAAFIFCKHVLPIAARAAMIRK